MAKRIHVALGKAQAQFVVQDDLAPKATAVLWDALPLSVPIRRSALSGESCSATFSSSGLAALPARREVGVASIYPGWMVLQSTPGSDEGELVISFGLAEYRTPTGRHHVTPVAELDGDGHSLLAALRGLYDGGEQTIELRQAAD